MPQTVEISLKIPSLRVAAGVNPAKTIGNDDVRFSKQIDMDHIPKVGDVLDMSISSGGTFACRVVRSDWHHEKNCFVIACRYSNRSISHAEYQALMNSSDWKMRALL